MREKAKLDLVILEQVLMPTDNALVTLSEIDKELNRTCQSAVSLAGLFVLTVSQIEIAIAETLCYILKRCPWKMELDKVEVKRDDLFESELVAELIEDHIDGQVRNWSYAKTETLLKQLFKAADLPADRMQIEKSAEIIQSLKGKRNEILHQPKPENSYNQGGNQWVTKTETAKAVLDIYSIIKDIQLLLKHRYANYSKISALRMLWSYLFTTPLMARFEDYWVLDEKNDSVIGYKNPKAISSLARSERILLGFWRADFGGDVSLLSEFYMKSLNGESSKKLMTLLAALRYIHLY